MEVELGFELRFGPPTFEQPLGTIEFELQGGGCLRPRFWLDLDPTWFLNPSDNFDQIVFIFVLWKS